MMMRKMISNLQTIYKHVSQHYNSDQNNQCVGYQNKQFSIFLLNLATTACSPPRHPSTKQFTVEQTANAVVHQITMETTTKYEKLANDPVTKDVWQQAMCKELGHFAQGIDETAGINTVFFMSRNEIRTIPKDRTATYAWIVVDYRPQKADPKRVWITVEGNLIEYPGKLTPRTVDLTTTKILWNSLLSLGCKFWWNSGGILEEFWVTLEILVILTVT